MIELHRAERNGFLDTNFSATVWWCKPLLIKDLSTRDKKQHFLPSSTLSAPSNFFAAKKKRMASNDEGEKSLFNLTKPWPASLSPHLCASTPRSSNFISLIRFSSQKLTSDRRLANNHTKASCLPLRPICCLQLYSSNSDGFWDQTSPLLDRYSIWKKFQIFKLQMPLKKFEFWFFL